MGKHSKTADLLKVLGGTANAPASPPVAETAAAKTPEAPKAREPRKGLAKTEHPRKTEAPTRGKAIQFYLHTEDEKIIRELAAWLAPHRKRINDSLVIKTALRAAKTGHEFLAAYDAAIQVDGRTRQNRPKSR